MCTHPSEQRSHFPRASSPKILPQSTLRSHMPLAERRIVLQMILKESPTTLQTVVALRQKRGRRLLRFCSCYGKIRGHEPRRQGMSAARSLPNTSFEGRHACNNTLHHMLDVSRPLCAIMCLEQYPLSYDGCVKATMCHHVVAMSDAHHRYY